MINKKKLDIKLRKYISHRLSRGHKRENIKSDLANYGYDEIYIESVIKKNLEAAFVKKYAIAAVLLFFVSAVYMNFMPSGEFGKITGLVSLEQKTQKYFVISISSFDGSLAFENIALRDINYVVASKDNSGYKIILRSNEGNEIYSAYKKMDENMNYQVYVPYYSGASSIEIYSNGSKIMEIGVK